MESEELIKLVDGIYKNILDKFNPGARQMIYAGKAYLKALHGAAAASRLYVETISKLARQAQQGTWGGSSDIGAALMKVVDVFKEIQEQQMNILKAFYVDLLVPLETNLEKDTKVIQSEQKRFLQQHKQRVETYSKVAATMKKQRKKSRGNSKTEMAMDKELKNMQMLEQEKTKLDAFCEQSLRNAMTQERRRYGFVLERQCSLAKHQLSYYSVAANEYQNNLEKWEEIAKTRECLPETAMNIFSNKLRGIPSWQTDDVYSNPRSPNFDDDRMSQASQLRKTKSIDTSSLEIGSIGGIASPTGTISRAKSEFNLNSHYSQDVHNIQRPKSMAIPPPPQWDAKLAKALYAYLSSGENQLSFLEDDIIAIIGKRNKGWQFGENLRTQCSGWFPLAYTEVLEEPNMTPSRSAVSRSRNDLTHAESHKNLDQSSGGNNDLFSQRMFGDTVHFNRTSSNAKQILHALDSNKMPPPTSPPPVPKTSPSYRKQMISHSTNSLTKNFSQTENSSNNRPSRNMRGGNMHQNYQDSGFDNEPPIQPEIDYMDENSGGSYKKEVKSLKNGKNDKNNNLTEENSTKHSYGSLSRPKYEMANDQIEKKLKRTKSFWKFNKNNSETEILEGMSLWKHRDLVDIDEKFDKNLKMEKTIKTRDRSSDSDRTVTNKSSKNSDTKKKEIKRIKEEKDKKSQDSDYEYSEKQTKNMEFYDDEDGLLLKTVNRKNILQQYDNEDSDSTIYSDYNIPRDNPYDCILVNDQKFDKKQGNLRAKLQQKNNENEKNKLNNNNKHNVNINKKKQHNNEIIQFPEIRHSLRTFKGGKGEKKPDNPGKKTSYESIKSENSERKWGGGKNGDFESVYADSDYDKYEKNDFYSKSLQRRNKDYESKFDKLQHNGDMCGPWYDLWNLDVTTRK